jgi:hypothetical protein
MPVRSDCAGVRELTCQLGEEQSEQLEGRSDVKQLVDWKRRRADGQWGLGRLRNGLLPYCVLLLYFLFWRRTSLTWPHLFLLPGHHLFPSPYIQSY